MPARMLLVERPRARASGNGTPASVTIGDHYSGVGCRPLWEPSPCVGIRPPDESRPDVGFARHFVSKLPLWAYTAPGLPRKYVTTGAFEGSAELTQPDKKSRIAQLLRTVRNKEAGGREKRRGPGEAGPLRGEVVELASIKCSPTGPLQAGPCGFYGRRCSPVCSPAIQRDSSTIAVSASRVGRWLVSSGNSASPVLVCDSRRD